MTIGNRNTISFEFSSYSGDLLNLNFYLGNNLISREAVYVPTYIASLVQFLEQLNTGNFQNERFKDQTPTKVVETLESERDTNEPQYFRHLLQIDETTDQYIIFVLNQDELTQFNWYCWDKHNCNSAHKLNQIYTVTLPTSELISRLKQLISELKKELTNNFYK